MPSATRFNVRIQDMDDYTENQTWTGVQTFLDDVLIGENAQVSIGHLVPETMLHLKGSADPELRLEHTVDWESPILSLRGSHTLMGKVNLGLGADNDNIFDIIGTGAAFNTYAFVKGTGACWNAGIRFALSHLSPDDYGGIGVDQDDNVYVQNMMSGGKVLLRTENGIVVSVDNTGETTFVHNILQYDGKYISTDEIRARDGDGLKLYDDGGNGVFVKDGGWLGLGTVDPLAEVHVKDLIGHAQINIESGASAKQAYVQTKNADQSFVFGLTSANIWIVYDQTDSAYRFAIDGDGKIAMGGITDPAAQLHIDQAVTDAAIPVLILDQADIDQPIVKIIGTAESGSADRSLVAASDFTTPGAIVAWEMVYVQDDGNRFTDAKYYRPLYAIPTA